MHHTPRGSARKLSMDHETAPVWVAPRAQAQQDEHFSAHPISSRSVQHANPVSDSSREPSPNRHDDDGSEEAPEQGVLMNMLDDMFGEDSEEDRAFRLAPQTAPITKQSLSELDIGSIINNSKLRHDVNFDRELHFRPNMDGDRGQRKRSAQIQYWKAISVELHLIYHVLASSIEDSVKPVLITAASKRLLAMFETVKDILKNLVPERDQSDVDEHLDVPMLMQEISRGVCDFVSIAGWMAQLLKRHCAPMRDELVDKMVEKISRQTPDSIAAGLADLFAVLEAMKLDVANHQIRHLRALLIEDSINFERKYHFSRIRKQRYNCRAARRWFKTLRDGLVRVPMTGSWPNRDVEAFVKGFLSLLLPSTEQLPDTFLLDMDKIRQLKEDIDESLRDTICCGVLDELMSRRRAPMTAEQDSEFRQRMQSISGSPRIPRWHQHALDDIACEIVRFTIQATGSTAVTDADMQDTACQLLSDRLWATVRARNIDPHPESDQHNQALIQKLGKELYEQLFRHVFRTVEDYLSNSPYDIFLALVPPPAPPPLCPMLPTMRPMDRQQDLVRRIAHIAILHWRTWENLVYNNEDFDGEAPIYESQRPRLPTPGPATGSKKVLTTSTKKEVPAPANTVHTTDVDLMSEVVPAKAYAG